MPYDPRRRRPQDVEVLGFDDDFMDVLDDDDDDDVLGFSWSRAANLALNPFAQAQAMGVPVPQAMVSMGDPTLPFRVAKATYDTVFRSTGSKSKAKRAARKVARTAQSASPSYTPPVSATPQMYGAPPGASGGLEQSPFSGPARREVVGLGIANLTALLTTVTFSINNIGKPIRVERLVIVGTDIGVPAPGAETVGDLTIGVDSQLAGALDIPIEAFQPTAQSGVVLAGGWWYPGVTLTLQINRSVAPGGTAERTYTASIFGETPRSNSWLPWGQQG